MSRPFIDPGPIVHAYLNGKTVPQIAHDTGRKPNSIYRLLHRRGIKQLRDDRYADTNTPPRHGNLHNIMDTEKVQAIRDLKAQGYSYRAITAELGVSNNSIRKYTQPE